MSRTSALLLLTLVGACGVDDHGSSLPSARLTSLTDCNAAASYIKEAAVKRMNERINEELGAYIRGERCYRGGGYGEDDASPTAGGAGSGGGSTTPTGPTQGTGTNNQVAGVDEADFIKNDGQFIYLAKTARFASLTRGQPTETHEVSRTAIEGYPKKLFVLGDKALVYVASAMTTGYYNRECTYGYTCDFTGEARRRSSSCSTSRPRAPVLEREIALSGSLIAGRRVGSAVHTVVTQAANPFTDLQYNPDQDSAATRARVPMRCTCSARARRTKQLRTQNREKIMNTDLATKMPSVADCRA